MVEYERTPGTEATNGNLRICVVGIGGAGSNVIDRITVDRTLNATLVSLQTDVRVLNQSMAPKKVQLGAELMRGIGTGGDPDLGREAAIYSKDRIREAVEGHDMVFISAGLGGGTGSGAAPVVAEIAKSTGAIVVVFSATPFTFEGRRRQQQANEALERLQRTADALILFDNNRMGELVLGKEGIQKTFAQADTIIGQSVRAVSAMVGQPGLVKLGLADLVAALRVSDGRCLFGFGEAKGQNRGIEAMKRALKSPLINNGELLHNARNLLVHIVGGESLTLAEVEGVMKQLSRHVPDETQLLFGVTVDSKLGETVSVTLISALSAEELSNASVTSDASRVSVRAPVVEVVDRVTPAKQPSAAPTISPSPEAMASATSAAATAAAAVAFAPPADLFGQPMTPAPKAKAEPPAPAPEAVPTPAPTPAKKEAPKAAPAPVEEDIIEIDQTISEEEEFSEEVTAPVVQVSVPPPLPRNPGFNLASVISGSDGGLRPPPPEKEDASRYAPAPQARVEVTEPVPETAPVPLPSRSTNVINRAPASEPLVTAKVPVQETIPAAPPPAPPAPQYQPAPAFALQPEPEHEEEPPPSGGKDLFGNPASTAPASAPAPTKEEQPEMRLGSEDRGRFNGTEPAVVQGEDLDTPTWMRLRRRPR